MTSGSFRWPCKINKHCLSVWHQWLKEHLLLLQPRKKWLGVGRNLQSGDLLFVMDESVKSGHWPKGIVEAAKPDSNNLVRRVKVRTAQSTLVRDNRKLCFLESLVVENGH